MQYTPGQLEITAVESAPADDLRAQLVFIGTRKQPGTEEFTRLMARS